MRALGRTSAWLAGISAWFLLLASLLGGVFFLTHAYGFYEVEYAKYDAAADIGVSYEDLMVHHGGRAGLPQRQARQPGHAGPDQRGMDRGLYPEGKGPHGGCARPGAPWALGLVVSLLLGWGALGLAIVLAAVPAGGGACASAI